MTKEGREKNQFSALGSLFCSPDLCKSRGWTRWSFKDFLNSLYFFGESMNIPLFLKACLIFLLKMHHNRERNLSDN